MRWTDRIRMAVKALFQRESETAQLTDELQFHLEQQVEENIARGMSAQQARSAAMRAFGNPALLRDEARSMWSWNWLEKLARDVRYGIRTLRRSPGFSIVAIVVMALGIGATTSLFTIVHAVMLKPLPFRDPQNLVMVYEHFRTGTNDGAGFNYNVVSPGDFHDWRQQTHGFEDMAAWRNYGALLTGQHAELPEVVQSAAGSWNLFSVLGVQPALGRTFTQDEDRTGANKVVMLTWSLFQRRFHGDPSIVGKQIHLDREPYVVVGVLPSWFAYPNTRVQFWVPYVPTFMMGDEQAHDHHQSFVIARLRRNVSVAAATNEVSALQYRLHMQFLSKPVAEDAVSRSMIDDVVQDIKTPLIVLLCAVFCMLLIACLNISNLLVARGAARRKEVAVRSALGGSRMTLIREQMTESLLISIAGGALGLLLSFASTHWLAGHWHHLPRAEAIHVDGVVLAFSIGLIFLTALLAGLVPAISSTGKGVFTALKDSSRSVGGSVSGTALRKILLTAEIALTVVLLVSAGLLFKSFLHLRTTDLGSLTDHVLILKYGLPEVQYGPGKIIAFHEALLERVRRLPGVRAAGLVSVAPGAGYGGDDVFTIPEHPSQGPVVQLDAIYRTADPSYFSTMQIPLISGRFFTQEERLDRAQYVIISKRLRDQFFSGEDPLGKHLEVAWTGKPANFEIIGVVGDTLHDVTQPVRAMMYFPILSGIPNQTSEATLVLHTSTDPLTLSTSVQQQISALDPQLPVYDMLTMQQVVGLSTANESFNATLVLAFAALSLLLAAVGLYGVLSYLVTQRITEIGIRIALGAQRGQVLRLVLLDGLRPVFAGLVIGLAGGAGAGMLIRSMLYGTRPIDGTVLAAMVAMLLITAVAACALPALRASRIEPMQALRAE